MNAASRALRVGTPPKKVASVKGFGGGCRGAGGGSIDSCGGGSAHNSGTSTAVRCVVVKSGDGGGGGGITCRVVAVGSATATSEATFPLSESTDRSVELARDTFAEVPLDDAHDCTADVPRDADPAPPPACAITDLPLPPAPLALALPPRFFPSAAAKVASLSLSSASSLA